MASIKKDPAASVTTKDSKAEVASSRVPKLCMSVAVLWFNLWLLIATFNIFCACVCLNAVGNRVFSRALTRKCCLIFCGVWWRLPFKLSPWVRVQRLGFEHLAGDVGASGRSVMILANHTSFLDTLLFAATVPPSMLTRFASLVSPHLFKIPMLGTIMRSVGHISVPFREAGASGSFGLDEAKRSTMLEQVEAHLGGGGWICMYPEGTIHRGDGHGEGSSHTLRLQTFRAGGMAFLLDADMEVWGWATRGNNDCWPRSGKGGHPASIAIKLFPIAQNGAASLLRELHAQPEAAEAAEGADAGGAGPADLAASAADRIRFAAHAQQLMQEELHALMQEGGRSR